MLDLTVRGATAYGIPGPSINGNDIELMAKTTREAADRARNGEGPTFIDAKTYRYKGHSISDPAKYRRKEELDSAVKHDPDPRLSERPPEAWLDRSGRDRRRCSRASRTKSTRASSLPRRAILPPPEALYEDITVGPYIPQE